MNMTFKQCAAGLLLLSLASVSWGEVVFVGEPIAKVVMSGDKVDRTVLTVLEQSEFQSVIIEKAGRYFWKTREMKELERHQSGIYVTYQAVDGSGYVRIDSLTAHDSNTSHDISYIEHLKLGLFTITYQGRVVK